MVTVAAVQSQPQAQPNHVVSTLLSAPRQLLQLAPVLVQVALVTLIIRLFHLESRSLFYVMVLVTLAFPFHAVLPLQYRLRAFVLLSFTAIVVALGLVDGGLVILMASSMLALCMLPVRVSVRVAAVLALGALWALARVDLLFVGLPAAIWPVLGSHVHVPRGALPAPRLDPTDRGGRLCGARLPILSCCRTSASRCFRWSITRRSSAPITTSRGSRFTSAARNGSFGV